MLTMVDGTVDGAAPRSGDGDAPRTVMWTIQQIADRDGVSKQAVSKQVARLVERHNLMVERDAQGRVLAVNVVEYDHYRERFANPSKVQKAKPDRTTSASSAESYDEALRQKTWLEAEQKKIGLAQQKRDLIPATDLDRAVDPLADTIVAVFDELVQHADEIANAVARGGLQQLRATLKKIVADQRRRTADALERLPASVGRQQQPQ